MKEQTTDEKICRLCNFYNPNTKDGLCEYCQKAIKEGRLSALDDVTKIIRQDIRWYSGYGADGEKDKDILQQARAILNYCIELQNKIAKRKEKL